MNQPLNLIIVEDDPLIAFDLKEVALGAGYYVIAVCHTKTEVEAVDLSAVDLALLDINLNEQEDGIDIGIWLKENHQIPCVFITSYYDGPTVERAKQASPFAYILKPYEEQDVLTNLELSKARIQQELSKSAIAEPPKMLFVKKGNKLIKVKPNEVDFAQAFDMYTHLFSDGNRITASQTLKEVEKLFAIHNFIRVHRSYLVNLSAIDGICEDEILINTHKIPIGRTYKKVLFEKILTI